MGTKKGKKYVTLLLITEKAGEKLAEIPGAYMGAPLVSGAEVGLYSVPIEDKDGTCEIGDKKNDEADKKKKEEKKAEPEYLNGTEKK